MRLHLGHEECTRSVANAKGMHSHRVHIQTGRWSTGHHPLLTPGVITLLDLGGVFQVFGFEVPEGSTWEPLGIV
jgi:hypothetical protein